VDLSANNIFILHTVVDDVSHPVQEISTICATERDNDLIVSRVVGHEPEGIKEFIFNAIDL
jgi:hypothetical protein